MGMCECRCPTGQEIQDWLRNLVLHRGLELDDKPTHLKYWKYAWLLSFVYSIVYGIWEYFAVYNYLELLEEVYGSPTVNWMIMYVLIVLLTLLVTKGRIENALYALIFMVMFEDVIFWLSQWADLGKFPYPAGGPDGANWWDRYFASFRVLGYLGSPAGPLLVPRYYFLGFPLRIFYDLCSFFGGPKWGRAWTWLTGPLFCGLLVGCAIYPPCYNTDITTCENTLGVVALTVIPALFWIYLYFLIWYNYGHLNKELVMQFLKRDGADQQMSAITPVEQGKV